MDSFPSMVLISVPVAVLKRLTHGVISLQKQEESPLKGFSLVVLFRLPGFEPRELEWAENGGLGPVGDWSEAVGV